MAGKAGMIGVAGGIPHMETVGKMNRAQGSGRVAPGEMGIKAATGSPACTSIEILIGNTQPSSKALLGCVRVFVNL